MSEKRIAREVSKTLCGGVIAGLLAGEINFQVSDGEMLGAIALTFLFTFFLFGMIEAQFGSPDEDESGEASEDDPEYYYEGVRYAS